MPSSASHELPTPDWEAFYASYRKPGYVPGYEITLKLGGGAFGIVFCARKQSIGKDYAIKFLKVDEDAEVRRGVLAELDSVRLFAQVDHPNLVAIEDRGEVDGIPYLVMGFAGNETLRDRLPSRDAADCAELRVLFLQACRGVHALHQHGLVHFDLKPANIFIKGGVARVGDYGLSRLLTHSRASLSMGRGTPYYMAPELLKRRGDWRSDIYALGVMLYEILVGRVPFEGDSEWEVLRKHESEVPELPSSLRADERTALARCLAKDPAERFQSVAELMTALGAAQGLGPAAWQSPSSGAPIPPPIPEVDRAAVDAARAKLKRAAKDAGEAARTYARHAAQRAQRHARKSVDAAMDAAREAGVAGPNEQVDVSGPGGWPATVARSHWHAFRLRRKLRRAQRAAVRKARREHRRRSRPWLVIVAGMGVLAIGAVAMLVPASMGNRSFIRASADSAPAIIHVVRDWEDARPLRAGLDRELRGLMSLSPPTWSQLADRDPDTARVKLRERLAEFESALSAHAKSLSRASLPDFGPIVLGRTADSDALWHAVFALADGRDVDGSERAKLLGLGRVGLDAAAWQLSELGLGMRVDEDRARAARLHEFLRETTEFEAIAFDAQSPQVPQILRENEAAGPLWRWFLHEVARDDDTWRRYLELRPRAVSGGR